MCGCNSSFDGYDEEIEEVSNTYTDFDGEEEFDNFLTKRSRARRKMRRKLRKSGVSRKDARKQARSKIPRQKLGALLKNVVSFKTSQETKDLIKKSGVKPSVADKLVNDALKDNTSTDNTSTDNTSTDNTSTANIPITQAGGGKGKMAMMIGIGAVVIIGGWFAWKKLG